MKSQQAKAFAVGAGLSTHRLPRSQPVADTARDRPALVCRSNLDFHLDDVPRHWLGGDAFRSRYFDALSTFFPDGERFFISCVRDYRDRITDPQLASEVTDFIRQEAEHGRIHSKFNERLQAQGVSVDRIGHHCREGYRLMRRFFSPAWNLACTAATEHITSVMSHGFLGRNDVFADADPNMRALYAWHGVEEIEHSAVAFDVMTRVARVGYFFRCLLMVQLIVIMTINVFLIMNHMFKADGFGFGERMRLWRRGLGWLYGRNGLWRPLMPHLLDYFRPRFHPLDCQTSPAFHRWTQAYQRNADPIAAYDAIFA
jgi:predicted metal-dependent hydrolase